MDYEDDILVETENEVLIETEEETKEQSSAYKNFPKYSDEKLERVYNKYDFSKSYNPNSRKKETESFEKFVKHNSEEDVYEESFTVEKTSEQNKSSQNTKFNIFKICGTAICFMLIILSMINLATITNLEQSINKTQNQISQTEVNVGKLIQDVGKLTNKDDLLNEATQNGMEQVEQEIEIVLNEKNNIIEYESKTNFFDKICEFISNIFGG